MEGQRGRALCPTSMLSFFGGSGLVSDLDVAFFLAVVLAFLALYPVLCSCEHTRYTAGFLVVGEALEELFEDFDDVGPITHGVAVVNASKYIQGATREPGEAFGGML